MQKAVDGFKFNTPPYTGTHSLMHAIYPEFKSTAYMLFMHLSTSFITNQPAAVTVNM